MQDIEIRRRRRSDAHDPGIGKREIGCASPVFHLLAHREHILSSTRGPPEDQALAIAKVERDRLAGVSSAPAGPANSMLVGQLSGWLFEPTSIRFDEKRPRRSQRRQEHDDRATRIDRLMIAVRRRSSIAPPFRLIEPSRQGVRIGRRGLAAGAARAAASPARAGAERARLRAAPGCGVRLRTRLQRRQPAARLRLILRLALSLRAAPASR